MRNISYELAPDGGLRTIYIHSAQRKQLTTVTETVSEQYYPVDGGLLTLPYTQLLNLNISYFIDEQDARAEGDSSSVTSESEPQISLTSPDSETDGQKPVC